jgi:hypothetical protein
MPLLAIIIDTPFTPDYTHGESPDLEEHGATGLSLGSSRLPAVLS